MDLSKASFWATAAKTAASACATMSSSCRLTTVERRAQAVENSIKARSPAASLRELQFGADLELITSAR